MLLGQGEIPAQSFKAKAQHDHSQQIQIFDSIAHLHSVISHAFLLQYLGSTGCQPDGRTPKNTKGITYDGDTVASKLGAAGSYVRPGNGAPSATAARYFEMLRSSLALATDKVNTFMAGDLANLRESVNSAGITLLNVNEVMTLPEQLLHKSNRLKLTSGYFSDDFLKVSHLFKLALSQAPDFLTAPTNNQPCPNESGNAKQPNAVQTCHQLMSN
jgi:hypothetical protein